MDLRALHFHGIYCTTWVTPLALLSLAIFWEQVFPILCFCIFWPKLAWIQSSSSQPPKYLRLQATAIGIPGSVWPFHTSMWCTWNTLLYTSCLSFSFPHIVCTTFMSFEIPVYLTFDVSPQSNILNVMF
jgi:hypothetical protein